jgi:hypothetical protein
LDVVLDALGDDLQSEGLAQLHEHLHERRRLLRGPDLRHEATVDLEDIDGELAEIGER